MEGLQGGLLIGYPISYLTHYEFYIVQSSPSNLCWPEETILVLEPIYKEG